jgi:hypothetical protein
MNQEKDKARRRELIKASLAMPMIATLPSGGSALANASTNQCIINAKESLEMKGEVGMGVIMPEGQGLGQGNNYTLPTPDEYLRVSVPVGQLKDKNNASTKIDPVYLIGDKYFDNDGNRYMGEDIIFKEYSQAYVALVFRHDSEMTNAEFVGVWPESGLYGENVALNGSCWTSLSPAAQLKVNV